MKKARHKFYMLHYFIWNLQNRQTWLKLDWCLPRAGELGRKACEMTAKGCVFPLGVIKMFKTWFWWWWHNSVHFKNDWIVSFKWVKFMLIISQWICKKCHEIKFGSTTLSRIMKCLKLSSTWNLTSYPVIVYGCWQKKTRLKSEMTDNLLHQ